MFGKIEGRKRKKKIREGKKRKWNRSEKFYLS